MALGNLWSLSLLHAYREVDADGLVLPVDLVCQVVKQADDGGLLQGHGGAEPRVYDGRPRQGDAVPVVQVGEAHAAVVPQETVQGALRKEARTRGSVEQPRWEHIRYLAVGFLCHQLHTR